MGGQPAGTPALGGAEHSQHCSRPLDRLHKVVSVTGLFPCPKPLSGSLEEPRKCSGLCQMVRGLQAPSVAQATGRGASCSFLERCLIRLGVAQLTDDIKRQEGLSLFLDSGCHGSSF